MSFEQDRQNAIKVVELACSEGQIIPADRDARIELLKQAQSPPEIDSILGSLRGRTDRPVPAPGPMVTPSYAGGGSRSLPIVPLLGGLVSVVAGIAIVVFLVNLLSGLGDGDPQSGPHIPNPLAREKVDVLSADGFADLVAAVKEQTGTTSVFDATLYPTYAVLQLPVDRESKRQQYFYWDGSDLESRDSFGRSSEARLDLTTVNVRAMLRLVRQAKKQIEEPNTWYVILDAPDPNDATVISAYASNKFTEGGYIAADANGKEIRRTTW